MLREQAAYLLALAGDAGFLVADLGDLACSQANLKHCKAALRKGLRHDRRGGLSVRLYATACARWWLKPNINLLRTGVTLFLRRCFCEACRYAVAEGVMLL